MELPAGSGLPLSSEELAIFKEGPRNCRSSMYTVFCTVGVKVPAIYGHWEDERILLLEDLGDTALWDQVKGLAESKF